MNRGYVKFFGTDIGVKLAEVLQRPLHLYGYILLSRRGVPAIEAAAWELDPLLITIPPITRDYAKQACGALVGELVIAVGGVRQMTASNQPRRARVSGSSVLNMAAVWDVSNVDLARIASRIG